MTPSKIRVKTAPQVTWEVSRQLRGSCMVASCLASCTVGSRHTCFPHLPKEGQLSLPFCIKACTFLDFWYLVGVSGGSPGTSPPVVTTTLPLPDPSLLSLSTSAMLPPPHPTHPQIPNTSPGLEVRERIATIFRIIPGGIPGGTA